MESKANKCTQGNATKYDNVKTYIWKGKKIEMQNENKGFAMCILVKKEIWQTTKPINQMHLECTFETIHACKGRRKKKCKMKV